MPHQIDIRDVEAARSDISGNESGEFAVAEVFEDLLTLCLRDVPVERLPRQMIQNQQPKSNRARNRPRAVSSKVPQAGLIHIDCLSAARQGAIGGIEPLVTATHGNMDNRIWQHRTRTT